MKISGFTFIHNALSGGYPIREAIQAVSNFVDEVAVVDMQSTDGTKQLLEKLGVRILDGAWIPGGGDHACLDLAYTMHTECCYDTILHFEADEVYDPSLVEEMVFMASHYCQSVSVLRLQIEQNFQRIRQNLLPVHRLFRKGSTLGLRAGHTTKVESGSIVLREYGYLWDCTNDFRDNYLKRVERNAELHGGQPRYLMVPLHCTEPAFYTRDEAIERLKEPQWTYEQSPFRLPANLQCLVGKTKYE